MLLAVPAITPERGAWAEAGGLTASITGVADVVGGPTTLEHIRRDGNLLGQTIHLAATSGGRAVECTVEPRDSAIAHRVRETLLEGRGWFTPDARAATGAGTLVAAEPDEPDALDPLALECVIGFSEDGQFHRVGTAAWLRLHVTLTAERSDGAEVFRADYCLSGVLDAVPMLPQLATAQIVASGTGAPGPCPADRLFGRTVSDENEHG